MLTTIIKIVLEQGNVEILDKYVIENVNSQLKTKFSPNLPSYGISAGIGSITFKDISHKFLNYSKQGLLTSDIPIEIYIKNMVTGDEQIVSSWVSKSWNYDVDDNNFTVLLRDNIEDMQKIDMNDAITYLEIQGQSMSGLDFYNYIKSLTPEKFVFDTLDENVSSLLSSVVIETPYLQANNLWSYYELICQLCLLQMFKNPHGEITFKTIV